MRCIICGNSVLIIPDEKFNINYFNCVECDFIFINHNNIISPEKEKKNYMFHNNTSDNAGYVNMFKEFLNKAVFPFKNNKGTALDFGCGPGPVLAGLLKGEGYTVDIYDKYFVPKKVYKNKKYDLITSTEVFEHLKNPLSVINELKNHLTANGILAIMTLFHPQNNDDFAQWWYRRDETHISFYTPVTFDFMAALAGMEVVFYDYRNTVVLKKNNIHIIKPNVIVHPS